MPFRRSLYNRDHLSDSPPPSHHHPAIKRERDSFNDFSNDRDRDFPGYPPEKKRPPSTPTRTPATNQQHHLDTSTEERPETPIHENGTDLSKSMLNSKLNHSKNGFGGSEGQESSPALLNGMQFKIISRGKFLNNLNYEQQFIFQFLNRQRFVRRATTSGHNGSQWGPIRGRSIRQSTDINRE